MDLSLPLIKLIIETLPFGLLYDIVSYRDDYTSLYNLLRASPSISRLKKKKKGGNGLVGSEYFYHISYMVLDIIFIFVAMVNVAHA